MSPNEALLRVDAAAVGVGVIDEPLFGIQAKVRTDGMVPSDFAASAPVPTGRPSSGLYLYLPRLERPSSAPPVLPSAVPYGTASPPLLPPPSLGPLSRACLIIIIITTTLVYTGKYKRRKYI